MPTASGANSVASALGFRSGATPFGHDHPNTTFQQPSSKPDISIWQRRGHFYLALTALRKPCRRHVIMSCLCQIERVHGANLRGSSGDWIISAFPEIFKAPAETAAAQSDDAVGAVEGPVHTGAF